MSLLEKLKQQRAEMAAKAQQEQVLVAPKPAAPEPAPVVAAPKLPTAEPEPEVVAEPAQKTALPSAFGARLKVPTATVATPAPTSAAEKLKVSALTPKPGGAIAALMARGKSDLVPQAMEAVDYGEVYTAGQFLSEIQELGEGPDAESEPDEARIYNESLTEILRKGTTRLNEMLNRELAGLATPDTDPATFKELGNIVRITWSRVKTAPTAWSLLTLTEQSAVVQATIAMAKKRNSAAKARPVNASKSEASADEAIAAIGVSADDLDALLDGFAL